MRLCREFCHQGQELSPPICLNKEREPSKAPPQRSRIVISKQTRGQIAASRRPLGSINEVEESLSLTKPSWERTHRDRLRTKKNRQERSPEQPQRSRHKKSRLIELRLFAKWIHNLLLDPSLKILQFVLYSEQSRPHEHLCHYKFIMSLVTND